MTRYTAKDLASEARAAARAHAPAGARPMHVYWVLFLDRDPCLSVTYAIRVCAEHQVPFRTCRCDGRCMAETWRACNVAI